MSLRALCPLFLIACVSTGPSEPAGEAEPAAAPESAEALAAEGRAPGASVDTLTMIRGLSLVLTLPQVPDAAWIDDPSVATVSELGGPARLHIRGVGEGQTWFGARFEDRDPITYSIEVGPPKPPRTDADASDLLVMDVGDPVTLELPRVPTAFAVGDPGLLTLQVASEDGQSLALSGRAPGVSDVLLVLGPDDPPMIYEVTVTAPVPE